MHAHAASILCTHQKGSVDRSNNAKPKWPFYSPTV